VTYAIFLNHIYTVVFFIVQLRLTKLLSVSILDVSLWMLFEIPELLVFGQNLKKQISWSPNLRSVLDTTSN